jgi:lysophospholipase L1-like esterase
LIDLHQLSHELYARLGPTAQDQVGALKTDRTHFNTAGAKMIAGLVAEALGQVVPALRVHLLEHQ